VVYLKEHQAIQFNSDVLGNWSAPDASEYDLLKVPAVRYVVVITYVIIITLGALGNGLVVVVQAACSRTTRPLQAKGSQVGVLSSIYIFEIFALFNYSAIDFV